jgi:multicomponent Na+:H+ antiporter subunit B
MMRRHVVLRIVTKAMLPFILLFALYVQFHGEYGPGGGFQAGVIFGAAFILYGIIFGLAEAKRVAPPAVVEMFVSLGILLYAGVGVWSMLKGGNFLEYGVLLHDSVHGQHLGILLIELGVGITVSAVMVLIFFNFAGRGRAR